MSIVEKCVNQLQYQKNGAQLQSITKKVNNSVDDAATAGGSFIKVQQNADLPFRELQTVVTNESTFSQNQLTSHLQEAVEPPVDNQRSVFNNVAEFKTYQEESQLYENIADVFKRHPALLKVQELQ